MPEKEIMKVVMALCALQLACGNPPTAPTPAPAAPPPVAPAPPSSVVLGVHIVEATTGNPVAGAFLIVRRSGESLQFSEAGGDKGAIHFNDFKPGIVIFTAARRGYESTTREVSVDADMTIELPIVPRHFALTGRTRFTFPEVTITHSGSTVANAPGEFAFSYFAFTGTLRDPARIGSTTEISGTLRWTTLKGGPRTPTTCVGMGTFTGTVNWGELRITAPRLVYDCPDEPPVAVTLSLVRQQ